MFKDHNDHIDGQQITPADVMNWFPRLEHREACRLLWEWKSRSNGRNVSVSRGDLESLMDDIQVS